MSQYISVEIHAEDIIQGMCDDADFMIDVFDEIAQGLSRGLLLDNAVDSVPSWKGYKQFKANMLELFGMVDDRYMEERK